MDSSDIAAGIPEVESLPTVFRALHEHVVGLFTRWELHRELFRAEPEQIDLLNANAPFFFGSIQRILLDDVISGIARLTDKAGSGSHVNLALRQLVDRLGKMTPVPAHHDRLVSLLGELETTTGPIRQVRNKRLSHSDLQLALAPGCASLPRIPYKLVDDSLCLVARYLQEFQFPFTNCTIRYLDTISPLGGGKSLVSALKRADRYRELFRKGLLPSESIVANTPDVTL